MFHALNSPSASSSESASDDDSSDSEVQQTSAITENAENDNTIHDKYRNALNFYSQSKFVEAKTLFEQLINEKIFINICRTKPIKKAELQQLYFGALKNLAAIYADEDNSHLAVDYYLKAVDICKSDVVVFYRLGTEAFKSEQFSLARDAFEEGLKVSPEHWLCLDKLIAVLYIIGDYASCLMQIKTALEKDNNYIRGLVLKDEICYRNPYLTNLTKKFFDEMHLGSFDEQEGKKLLDRHNALADRMTELNRPKPDPVVKPNCQLSNLSWLSLAESICQVCDDFEKENITFSRFVDLTDWINNTAIMKEVIAPTTTDDNLQLKDPINVSLDISMDTQISSSVPVCSDSIALDSTMDSIISESDNEAKSVTATSTTSGGDVGFEEAQGVLSSANSDQECVFAVSQRITKGTRGRKRKSQAAINASEAKRRSTRLIPGFLMEDPEAFGPLTTKPVSLKDQLYSYLPAKLVNVFVDDEQSTNFSSTPCDIIVETSSDVFSCCDILNESCPEDVLELLKISHKCCFTELLWNFVKTFRDSWRLKWSDNFCRAYLKCCKYWSKNVQFMTPRCTGEPVEWLKEVAQVRLIMAELEMRFTPDEIKDQLTHLTEYLSQMACFRSTYGAEWTTFGCRVAFYRAKRAELCKNFVAAKIFFEQSELWLSDDDENDVILLPNSFDIMSKTLINQKLNAIEKRQVLNSVETYFEMGKYQSVIDVLSSKNDVCSEDAVGLKEKFERSKLLAKSYLALNDYKLLANSVVVALRLCLEVYRRLDFVEKYDWWKNFDEILSWVDVCMRQNERIFDDMKFTSLKTFAETLIELILCFLDYGGCNQRQKDVVPVSCWVDTWIFLYKICKHLEIENLSSDNYIKTWYATADSHNVVLATKSLMILDKAHDELGKKGLCMLKEGLLLSTLAEELMKSLRHVKVAKYLTSSVNDDTLNCAEQCFYCLYNYPRKRSRCLVEHSAKNISLNWERSQLVFDFVRPETPPEFDDQPHNCISSETVHLLHRIEALVPEKFKPDQFLSQLEDFIDGRRCDLPFNELYVDTPIVRDLFHLLADFYGKAKDKDVKKVCSYYELDLCVSSERIDSWAGLAIHKGTIVDQTLNSLDLKYDDDGLAYVNNLAQPALFCYRKATSMIPDHIVLMVEHGTLAYALHSFVRRMFKRRFANGEMTEKAEQMKKMIADYLTESRTAFDTANRVPRTPGLEYKEDWVRYYILGKIAEKFDERPSIVLPYYHRAAYFLHMDGAKYPTRLPYNAIHCAFEALEIFYRVHASALKWLTKKKDLSEIELTTIWKYLRIFSRHPFKVHDHQTHHGRPSLVEKKSSTHGRLFLDPDAVEVVDNLLSDIELNEFNSHYPPSFAHTTSDLVVSQTMNHILTESEKIFQKKLRKEIFKWCLEAMNICIKRCCQFPHYKAYYWLAWCHFYSEEVKDIQKSRQLLIGPNDSHVSPFFQNLKGQNLFEGIWVIPTDDVSRAGSLAAHLLKMVVLLEKIFATTGDYEHLCELSVLLMRKPGSAKSKYLRESDREEVASLVFNSVKFVVKKEFKKALGSQKALENVCLTAYNCFTDWSRSPNITSLYRIQWHELIKWLYTNLHGKVCSELPVALNYFQTMSMQRKAEQRSLQLFQNRSPNKNAKATFDVRKPREAVQTYAKSPVRNTSTISKNVERSQEPEVILLSHSPPTTPSSNEITIIKEIGAINRTPTTSSVLNVPHRKQLAVKSRADVELVHPSAAKDSNQIPFWRSLLSAGIAMHPKATTVGPRRSMPTGRQILGSGPSQTRTVRELLIASQSSSINRPASTFPRPFVSGLSSQQNLVHRPSNTNSMRFLNPQKIGDNSDRVMVQCPPSTSNLDTTKQTFPPYPIGQTCSLNEASRRVQKTPENLKRQVAKKSLPNFSTL